MNDHSNRTPASEPAVETGQLACSPARRLALAVSARALAAWPELWFFVLASLMDIALTYVLIGQHGHVEANPVAAWFVYGWGLKGMVYFKLALVTIVALISVRVHSVHPRVSRGILRMGATAAGWVVAYSAVLLARVNG